MKLYYNVHVHFSIIKANESYTLGDNYLQVCDSDLERVLRVLNFAICTQKWYRVDIF